MLLCETWKTLIETAIHAAGNEEQIAFGSESGLPEFPGSSG